MEFVLEKKDARDWVYRGEGAANLVLAYNGCSSFFVGKVLRVLKVPTKGSPRYFSKVTQSALTRDECLVWKENEDLVSAPTQELVKQLYVQHFISPLLGSEYVDSGIRVPVSKEFLESVEENVRWQRPCWRAEAAKVNTLCSSALLLFDLSVFPHPHGNLKGELCITVEIKTSEISEYDPLDMFSGLKDRVHEAIKALFNTPQNNFRVFLNGILVFGSLGGVAEGTNCVIGEAFEDILRCMIQADDGLRITNFLNLLSVVLFTSGLLDRLLKVQKLDVFDIEGVVHLYYDIVSQPCVVCKNLGEDTLSGKYKYLHSMHLDESLKVVKDYLIAATAKDLSMMISFRPREVVDVESLYNGVFLDSSNQTFDYKASFIDLDMKPLKKIEYYYELDQKIVRHYSEMMEKDRLAEKTAGIDANGTLH